MKISKKGEPSAASQAPGKIEEISAENYLERAEAFIHACGGKGFVIRSVQGTKGTAATKEPATQAQWVAWLAYFRAKEIPHRFMLAHGLATVPAEWPELFDYAAPVSDKDARLPPAPAPLSESDRRGLMQKMAALSEKLVLGERYGRKFSVHEMQPAMSASHLADLQRRFTTEPCAPLAAYAVAPTKVPPAAAITSSNTFELDDTLP